MNNPPLIICGAPGSGTSLLAKMLRHAGVFLGADAGDPEDRKFHESASFRAVNQRWLESAIDFPHAPKGFHQFDLLEKLDRRVVDELVMELDLDRLMSEFLGGNSLPDNWGWKDPRNSATAFIWQEVFPEARIIVLIRKWNRRYRRQPANSLAGEWYRYESTAAIRNKYENPIRVDAGRMFKVDFDSLVRDGTEFNRLLREIGMADLQVDSFSDFRSRLGIES